MAPNAAQVGVIDMFSTHGGTTEAAHNLVTTGAVLVLLLFIVIGGVIAITQAQRKIPVQYAQRAVAARCMRAGTSFIPLRARHYSGVMPIIFAQSILMFPQPVLSWLANSVKVPFLQDFFRAFAIQLGYGSFLYLAIYATMILFFSYFWVATQFNEIQIADDLKKNGGYIPRCLPSGAGDPRLPSAQGDEPHHAGGRDFPDSYRHDPDHLVTQDGH